MLSDSDDWFDYNSSQNYSDIEYQIDLFEFRQSIKRDKSYKKKRYQSSYPMSTKKWQAHAALLKISSKRYQQKRKIKQKSFGYQFFSPISKVFECDEEILRKPTDTETTKQSKSSKKSASKNNRINFAQFRYHFYQKYHETIKSSLKHCSDIKIINIRLAPINESTQMNFMRRLNENSHPFPQLVYHGTKSKNIESILRFGFLVPDQVHSTIKNAPIIRSVNGQAYGQGIYCSRTAAYSVFYAHATNTILVCAAIPNYDRMGKVQSSFGNILVLQDVSQIIPLFLMDYSSLCEQGCDHHWYPYSYMKPQTDRIQKEKQPMIISKQILRKILSHMNNRARKNERYQIRLFV